MLLQFLFMVTTHNFEWLTVRCFRQIKLLEGPCAKSCSLAAITPPAPVTLCMYSVLLEFPSSVVHTETNK